MPERPGAAGPTLGRGCPAEGGRISVPELRGRKRGRPVVCLTAYTTSVAQRLDPHVDLLLVGDSLAMVVYGFETTRRATLDVMIAHGAAVVRGSKRACVVVDMPIGSCDGGPEKAYAAARRVMQETGAQGVKIEGGVELADTIRHLVGRGVPVMGHVGLLPQQVEHRSQYRIQGRDDESWQRVLRDGQEIARAGVFLMVIEGTVEPLARAITEAVEVPTIGIGASAACDGQILVIDDLVGLYQDFTPKFVRRYAEVGDAIETAARSYAEDVRARRFPAPEHLFGAEGKR